MVFDLVLRPHCDVHLALAGTPPLFLKVFRRQDDPAAAGRYKLTEVPRADLVFEFMAPHHETGHRFDNLPTVDATGKVVATTPGVYLFQIRHDIEYIVGRLQVHNQLVAWWFGNDSITTAKDTAAHAQPSVYAKFSDDPTGTDLIGDITGHGYVTLTSADPAKVTVTPEGRLRGLVETGTPVNVTGTFPGQPPRTLPVRVVDYAKRRRDLFPVQTPGVDHAADLHNIVFLAEGFAEADREMFDEIVTKAVDEIFNQERHQPYPMLEGSFNIFKVFTASQQHAMTCGFKVTDTDAGGVSAGRPIPLNEPVSDDPAVYTLEQLVRFVGLPKRGENRPNLKTLWAGQGLVFDANRIDDKLIDAWKAHQSVGILHAQDTFFGMQLGARWADRSSDVSDPPVPKPPSDTAGDPMIKYVARLYKFYSAFPTRSLTPDPRRHAPEVQAGGHTNPANSIVTYLKGLDYAFTPFHPIGPVWEPDDTAFKPSRGLVALICYDGVIGGTNLNNNTLTALTINLFNRLTAEYANDQDKRELRRKPPATVDPNFQHINDTIAHEFGHSFNLLDEYEEHDNDDTQAQSAADLQGDNVTRLGVVKLAGSPDPRAIDPAKVKWFALPRMRVSARLLVPAQQITGGFKVTIDKRYMAKWVEARKRNDEVHLRNFKVGPQGRQLPFGTGPDQFITGLHITGLDVSQGVITLTGPQLPPAGTVFATGSAVYVPLRDAQGQIITVVEKKVRDHLAVTHTVLNQDTNNKTAKKEPDQPVSISDFKAPCKSSKLIGIYEGAATFAGGDYRPAGNCKMRTSDDTDQGGEFCFVCKWLIVNRVDPHYHAILSGMFYPEAKKNG
jgi:hypothetical protein